MSNETKMMECPMENLRSTFGERIKFLRANSRESLQDVATAIGCSKAHLHDIEAEKSTNPSINLIRSLAIHFRVPIAALIETHITAQYTRPAAPVIDAGVDEPPVYTLKGIDIVLRQGIASESHDFKHQKLCEALDFLTIYKETKMPSEANDLWSVFETDSGNTPVEEAIGYIGYLSGVKDTNELKPAHKARFDAIMQILERDFKRIDPNPPPSKQPATDAVLNAWKIIEQQIAHSINPINREPEFEDLCFAKSVVRAALSAEKLDAEALKRDMKEAAIQSDPVFDFLVGGTIECVIDYLKAAHPQLFKGE